MSSQFADNLPLKSQIFEHWKDRLFGLGFFIDWGEPGCAGPADFITAPNTTSGGPMRVGTKFYAAGIKFLSSVAISVRPALAALMRRPTFS